MKKMLQVTYPPITSYSTHAAILSVLCDDEDFIPWFICHYTQLRLIEDGIDDGFEYMILGDRELTCDYLEQYHLPSFASVFIDPSNIVSFIKEMILKGFYLLITVNAKYIRNYKKDHDFCHAIFIYGFDDDINMFYVGDFFRNQKYAYEQCSYDEMREAFEMKNKEYWLTGIRLFRKKKNQFQFNLQEFRGVLQDYLYPEDHLYILMCFDKPCFKIGHQVVYEKLYDELMCFRECGEADIRLYSVFSDHIIVIKIACQYLYSIGVVSESIASRAVAMSERAKLNIYRIIKAERTKKFSCIEPNLFDSVRQEEYSIINSIIKIIDAN